MKNLKSFDELNESDDVVNLEIKTPKDLFTIAKYMTNAVKKNNWDLKDLIFYFEKDNGYDYKIRVKIWDEMKMFDAPKTYNNILKLIKAIVEENEWPQHGQTPTKAPKTN